jgi:hypothetical protein
MFWLDRPQLLQVQFRTTYRIEAPAFSPKAGDGRVPIGRRGRRRGSETQIVSHAGQPTRVNGIRRFNVAPNAEEALRN